MGASGMVIVILAASVAKRLKLLPFDWRDIDDTRHQREAFLAGFFQPTRYGQ